MKNFFTMAFMSLSVFVVSCSKDKTVEETNEKKQKEQTQSLQGI